MYYHAFLASIQGEAAGFKRRQQEAFEAERERWAGADPACDPATLSCVKMRSFSTKPQLACVPPISTASAFTRKLQSG